MGRLRSDERGQASVELLGLAPYILVTGLVVWQLLLATWAITSASNAARTGSRVEARGGAGKPAAIDALDSPLRQHAVSRLLSAERLEVEVRVPILIPGLDTAKLTVRRAAEFPKTS